MKNKKISKNIIYNSIGTFTYLFCQWLITFIVVWIAGYNTAGIFSLAMSITTTFSIFSTFNMRNYQSSDYKEYYRCNLLTHNPLDHYSVSNTL